MTTKVCDVGCGLGLHFREFVRQGSKYCGDLVKGIRPEECLGIDRDIRYELDVKGQGYQFAHVDYHLGAHLERLPTVDWYLCWRVLHTLPNIEHASLLVRQMLCRARRGLWLRLLSFEPDPVTGTGILHDKGLRFAWEELKAGGCPYELVDAITAIRSSSRPKANVAITAAQRVQGSDDHCVVPFASETADHYHQGMGIKTRAVFQPSLVSQWNIVVTF